MSRSADRAVEILSDLGSRPATPFFEAGPSEYVLDTLRRLGVDSRRDRFGNIIAHYRRGPENRRAPVAFVAHMDHPGFELVELHAGGGVAQTRGGVPMASLTRPTPVLVLTPDGRRVPGTTVPAESDGEAEGGRRQRSVSLEVREEFDCEPPLPVVFDLPDFELDGDEIRMRAADDLAGCASMLAVLERLVDGGAEADFYAVFTRAEEVGLYGARLVAEAGELSPETLVVSVESSAVIPGVEQGAGPVIRTGDRATTFDDGAERVLIAARESLRKKDADFKVQRQIMTGGTCEATAFAFFGYRVTGLAFPLGNYHNATTTIGDPAGGVGAEYIRLSDYLAGVDLLAEAAVVDFEHAAGRRWLERVPEDVRRRLAGTGHAAGPDVR